MIGWKKIFTTKTDSFRILLQRASEVSKDMCGILSEYVAEENANRREQLAENASNLEHEGDNIRQEIMMNLISTMITPFDREDIHDLSQAIDDIADYSENAIKEIRLYRITPDETIINMVKSLYEAVKILVDSIENLGSNNELCLSCALAAKSLENKIEGIYRRGIANLSCELDIHKLIMLREIYRHLSNAADRVDMAANRIMKIIVKEGQ